MPPPASASNRLHRLCRLQHHSAVNLCHAPVACSYAPSCAFMPKRLQRHITPASSLHARVSFHTSHTHAAASTTTAASAAPAASSPVLSPRPRRSRASPSRRSGNDPSHAPSSSSSPSSSSAATRTSRRSAAAAASPQPLPSRSAAVDSGDSRPQSVSAPPVPSSPPLFSVSVCSAARPHPDKAEGEDTHLLHSSASATTAVVYDGVGSWSFEQGVDVAAFSQRMRDATAEALAASPDMQPQQLMQAVWEAMDRDRIAGSSTACLLRVACDGEQAVLTAASVGDTGFLVLRRRVEGEKDEEATHRESTGSNADFSPITAYSAAPQPAVADTASAVPAAYVHYRSLQQLHWFNCPYQLGFAYLPPASSSSSSSASSSPSRSLTSAFDLPSSAVTTRLSLRPSDIVILASDGLFDNLDETEIVRIASSAPFPSLASQLLEAAWSRSLDRRVDGPFAVAAKDNNIHWAGGRKDDITVIALRVNRAAERAKDRQREQPLSAGRRGAGGRQTASLRQ